MLKGNTSRAENLTAGQNDFNWQAFSIALTIHVLLAVLLFANWNLKIESAGPMQVELWADGTPNAAPPVETEPAPVPPETPKPIEPPPPPPAPPPPPPPPPEPPAVTKAPEPVVDPDIALEEDRKKKEEEKRQQVALETARLEKEKLEKEKTEKLRLEKSKQERLLAELEQQRAEQAKLEKIKQEELKVAQQKREAALAKAKADEAAKKAEEVQAAETAKKEAEAKAQAAEAAEAAKKLAAAKVAEAAKKAAADKALKDAFRSDVMGATGIPGGTASSNQAGGGSDSGYAGKIRSCIKPGVSFPTPIRSGNINPFAEFRVQLKSDGVVSSTTLRKPSGNTSFDRAVEAGIKRCTPFPAPPSGRYPSYIDVNYFMYD